MGTRKKNGIVLGRNRVWWQYIVALEIIACNEPIRHSPKMQQRIQFSISSWIAGTATESTQFKYLMTTPDLIAMPRLLSEFGQKYPTLAWPPYSPNLNSYDYVASCALKKGNRCTSVFDYEFPAIEKLNTRILIVVTCCPERWERYEKNKRVTYNNLISWS